MNVGTFRGSARNPPIGIRETGNNVSAGLTAWLAGWLAGCPATHPLLLSPLCWVVRFAQCGPGEGGRLGFGRCEPELKQPVTKPATKPAASAFLWSMEPTPRSHSEAQQVQSRLCVTCCQSRLFAELDSSKLPLNWVHGTPPPGFLPAHYKTRGGRSHLRPCLRCCCRATLLQQSPESLCVTSHQRTNYSCEHARAASINKSLAYKTTSGAKVCERNDNTRLPIG